VSWWEWYYSLWTGDALLCDLSWWVTRALTAPGWLPRGSKVLVIDANPNDLTELLVYRGYAAVGLDAVNQRIVTAHHSTEAPIRFVDRQLILPEHYFDLVIARDLQIYQHNLSTPASLVTSANLLSSVKPGGRMSILVRQKPTWQDRTGGHLRSCFQRHFQHFSVNCQARFIGDDWSHWRTSQWMLGQHPRWGHLISTAAVPFEPLTRNQWHQLALADQSQVAPPCCAWIRRQESPATIVAATTREIPVLA
jgi:hypothetical protein